MARWRSQTAGTCRCIKIKKGNCVGRIVKDSLLNVQRTDILSLQPTCSVCVLVIVKIQGTCCYHYTLTLWPWRWTFKFLNTTYVKCEYFVNQKSNFKQYMTFSEGINGDCASKYKKKSINIFVDMRYKNQSLESSSTYVLYIGYMVPKG